MGNIPSFFKHKKGLKTRPSPLLPYSLLQLINLFFQLLQYNTPRQSPHERSSIINYAKNVLVDDHIKRFLKTFIDVDQGQICFHDIFHTDVWKPFVFYMIQSKNRISNPLCIDQTPKAVF